MQFSRRSLLACATLASLPLLSLNAVAQKKSKEVLNLGITLEPPGLDPTTGAAASISEIVLYNIFETLTKINSDGSVSPLLAQKWEISEDQKTYTFTLADPLMFHNGKVLDANSVVFSFTRAADEKSTNKDKRTFSNMRSIRAIDAKTVEIVLDQGDPHLLFLLGQGTAIIVEPSSAATNTTQPIGSGPYVFQTWRKGASVSLQKWDAYRHASHIKIRRATFKIITDPSAQVAALLAGDIDIFTRFAATRSLQQFQQDMRFQVQISQTLGKTILAINNQKKPLNDVRVRRALAAAIDRKIVIEGAVEGLGTPIGSHYATTAPGYIDTTGINSFNIDKAKNLLKEAGVTTPLNLDLILPPTPYARQGGEIIAAQLAQIGVIVKQQNVEWAQWLHAVYGKKQYDLSIVSHVEPFDLGNYAKKDYYWGYQSNQFDALFKTFNQTPEPVQRNQLLAEMQRLLAEDSVNVYLFQPQSVTVAHKNISGLRQNSPILVNDISAIAWN